MSKKLLWLYGFASLLGVLTGLLSSMFQWFILSLTYLSQRILSSFTEYSWLVSAFLSLVMIFLAFAAVRYFAREAAGSGVQEIEGALLHVRGIYWRRLLPIKFIGGVLAISSHALVGMEGPMIQMGGNLGAMLGEMGRFGLKRCDTLIAAGAAAGLASAFNAPLAGVLLVIEELRYSFKYSFINFTVIAISCVSATVTMEALVSTQQVIPMSVFQTPQLGNLGFFGLLGLVMGLAGAVFNKLLMQRLYAFDALSRSMRLLYIGVIGALIGILYVTYPRLVGGGYDIIKQSLTLALPLTSLFGLFFLRFILTISCYTLSIPGGIFAPMLALGTLLGLGVFYLFQMIFPGLTVAADVFAVAGMGALFSASIRAPLTGIVLVVEMTGNYYLILPLMVCCLSATTVMQLLNSPPIYTQLLKRTLISNKSISSVK
ncbi:MAG: H(+)/Cl(-) exchange transporter ClcA [Legionellaceae bacterium]|nr:H(+)/Cl(-) exchange transporter ClcA [Legionellaceae bacterium]HAF87262.1 H(+)/Cl(-) exchange transporter ClcA [Legionellales bacterium]HCA89469.1 H(+)/Cl(-) exchange transporter ClcA [Legionellales bacterium]|tara:strand:- start:1258 stop:2547 length:1290 start_codon:yes stop_codon:yes gene_type:complete